MMRKNMNGCFTRSIFPTNQTLSSFYLSGDGVSTEISGKYSYRYPGMPNTTSSLQHNTKIQCLTRKNYVLQDLGSRGCCVDEAHLGTLQSCLAMVTPESVNTAVNNTNKLLVYYKGWFL